MRREAVVAAAVAAVGAGGREASRGTCARMRWQPPLAGVFSRNNQRREKHVDSNLNVFRGGRWRRHGEQC